MLASKSFQEISSKKSVDKLSQIFHTHIFEHVLEALWLHTFSPVRASFYAFTSIISSQAKSILTKYKH
jgi:hypothetical protein